MLTFWIIAVAMMALAVAALMPSLLGRARHNTVSRKALNLAIYKERLAELQLDRIDSAQRDQTRAEIERELLEDLRNDGELPGRPLRGSHAMAAVVALLIPVLSVTVYSQLGSRTALERTAALPAMASAGGLPPDHPPMSGQQAMPSLEEMVARLAERLKSDPDNLEGWMMLGRSYLAMRQPEPARDAFARAYQLAPDNPDVLSGYAETSALVQGGSLVGQPAELVARLLEIAPKHPDSLWLAGLAAFQKGDYARAVTLWSTLSSMLDPGPDADLINEQLAQARSRLTGAAPEAEPVASATTPSQPVPEATQAPGPEIGRLAVEVSLSPALADRAAPSDTVFIFARAAEGPRMPLAIVRRRVSELPIKVTLDDSMAMTPAMKLSNFPDVVVGARVSKSGNAMPQAGDLEGLSPPISVGRNDPVKVTIDRAM
jgi:cytochrome c-type biogenesis protein CcmH